MYHNTVTGVTPEVPRYIRKLIYEASPDRTYIILLYCRCRTAAQAVKPQKIKFCFIPEIITCTDVHTIVLHLPKIV